MGNNSIPHRIATHLREAVNRIQPFVLVVSSIGVLLAYLTGMYVTGSFHETSRWMGAMLACTSVVVVLHVSGYKQSLQAGWMRVLGTFLGALIAYIYLSLWSFSILGMLLTVIVLESLCMLLDIYNNGRIATITLLIILLVSQTSPHIPPAVNCLLRFIESAVGVGVGVGVVWLTDAWNRWYKAWHERGKGSPRKRVNMDTMALRPRHIRLLAIASLGQLTGGALATLVGIILPLLQLVHSSALSSLQQGLIACTGLVGIMVGSMLFGGWSDRKGYLFFIRFCPLIVLAAALSAFWVDNLWGVVVGLFFMGLGIGGEYSLDSDYISEIMPRRWRLTMVGIAKAASAVGNVVVAAAGFWLLRVWDNPHTWNRLLLLVAGLAFVTVLCRIRFRQSPGWLMARGRTAEAEEAVRYFLGDDVDIGEIRRRPTREQETPKNAWSALFRKGHAKRVAFSGIPWACEGLGVYGVGIFLPILILSLGLEPAAKEPLACIVGSVETTTYINLAVLVGFASGIPLINRWSHVRTQTAGFIFSALGLGILLLAYELHLPMWVSLVGFLVFELSLNAGPHLMTFIIPPQIYPIADRGAGTGLAAAIGKMGGIVGVLFIPMLLKWGGASLVLGVTIGVLLFGAFVTAALGREVLPDRKPGTLPQIRHDR